MVPMVSSSQRTRPSFNDHSQHHRPRKEQRPPREYVNLASVTWTGAHAHTGRRLSLARTPINCIHASTSRVWARARARLHHRDVLKCDEGGKRRVAWRPGVNMPRLIRAQVGQPSAKDWADSFVHLPFLHKETSFVAQRKGLVACTPCLSQACAHADMPACHGNTHVGAKSSATCLLAMLLSMAGWCKKGSKVPSFVQAFESLAWTHTART